MGVCTKERKGVTAAVLMATPCTNSLGGESGGQKHEGCGGRSACWKFAKSRMNKEINREERATDIRRLRDRLDHPYGWTVVDTTSMYSK